MHKSLRLLFFCSVLSTAAAVAQMQNYSLSYAYRDLPNALEWQNADLSYQTAEQNLAAARAASGLSSNIGADGNHTQPLGSTGNAGGTITIKASASLPVLPWAASFDQVRSSQRALDRAALDRRDSRNSLYITATQQYWNARIAAADLENANLSQSIAQQQLQNAENQFKNGQISPDSLENTRRNLENTKITALQSSQNLELARLQLWNTLSITPTEAALESAPVVRQMPQSSLADLQERHLSTRTDVQKATSRLADAEDNLGIANRDRAIPSATLSAGVSQQGGGSLNSSLNFGTGSLSVSGSLPVVGASSTSATPTNLTVGVSVSIPITAPTADSKIETAKKNVESAKASLETTRRTARLDIQQKWSDALIQSRRTDVAQKTLENAKNSLETARQRLALGSQTALDVQNATLTMRQAARDLENQIATQHLAVMRLENALGQVVVGR
jgi:outer membrane protein